jgi:predicted dehydrogenase
MVLTEAQAADAFARAEAAGVLLVEAVWTRWHPRMRRIVQLATDGSLGDLQSFVGTFTFDGVADGNYRLEASRGGGALYDVGIYPLHGLLACLPDVEDVDVIEVEHAMGGVDVDLTTKATLAWGPGTRATVVGSFAMPASQRLTLIGSRGGVRVDDDEAWASWCKPTELWVNGDIERFGEVDAYQLMFEGMSAVIDGSGGWILPARDSIRVARVVDALLPGD